MIRINLLPQKRSRRAAAGAASVRGGMVQPAAPASGQLYLAIGALVLAGGAVFLGIDRPRRSRLNALEEKNDEVQGEIKKLRADMAGSNGEPSCEELRAKDEDAKQRAEGINRLLATKVVPAHMMHELGEILKQGHQPTMTEEWIRRTGPNGDPNKKLDLAWDPSNVWLTGFTDKDSTFTLEGGAQTEKDVTELALRLDASVYFSNVGIAGVERVLDRDSGRPFSKFTITGKVAY